MVGNEVTDKLITFLCNGLALETAFNEDIRTRALHILKTLVDVDSCTDHIAELQLFLGSSNVDLTDKDSRGMNLLMSAICKGSLKWVVRLLTDPGVVMQINDSDRVGNTALMYAAG